MKRVQPTDPRKTGNDNQKNKPTNVRGVGKKEGQARGPKINPSGVSVGIIKDWESKWYADKDYSTLLHEDIKIREYLDDKLASASVSSVEIERAANRVNITIHTGKPGMVIGK